MNGMIFKVEPQKTKNARRRNLKNAKTQKTATRKHPSPCSAARAVLVKKRRPVTRDRRADPTTREMGEGEGFED